MPDKHTPRDWSADETFWNDAWQDMQRRLHPTPRRRAFRPWLLALLLLLLIGAGTLVLRPQEEQTGSGKGEQLIATLDVAAVDPQASGVEHPPRASIAGDGQAISLQGDRPGGLPTRIASPNEMAPAAPPIGSPFVSTASIDSNEAIEDASIMKFQDQFATAFPATTPVLPLTIDVPPVYFPLTFSLPLKDIEVPDVLVVPITNPRWQVAAGVNNGTRYRQPGWYAQTSYRLSRESTFVTIALRYDRSHRGVAVRQGQSLAESLQNSFAPDLNNLQASSLADQVSQQGELYLTTSTLQLRSGLGRDLGRWTLTGGMGLHYTLGGSGPTFWGRDGNSEVLVSTGTESLNFQNADRTVGANASGDYLLLDNRVRRWNGSGWVQVDYRIRQRFSLSLGWSYLLANPYTEAVLDVERHRLDVGAGYRF
jgi:hypothetical protein